MASEIRVNLITNRSGLSTVTFNDEGLNVVGVVTATSFSGNLTGAASQLATDATGANLTLSGNLGVAGTVTYEDVTRVDATGISTFREGFKLGPLAGIALTAYKDGSIRTTGIITASGANFTSEVDISDGTFLDFGNGGLKIRTNANNAYITEATSGKLAIQGSNIEISNSAGTENYIYCAADGAVDIYYNGNKKFETTSSGINLTDQLTVQGNINPVQHIKFPDNKKTIYGTDEDFDIYHNNTHAFLNNSKGNLNFQTSGNIWMENQGGTKVWIKAIANGAVELFHDNTKVLETNSNGFYVYGPEGGEASAYFYSDEGDDNADKWRLRNDNAGTFIIDAKDSGSWITALQVSNSWININSREGNQGSAALKLKKNDAASNVQSTMITFEVGNQGRGKIVASSSDGASPSFSSWSDRRLKTNFRTYTGGYDKIKAIPVKLYDEVRTGVKDRVGWIADEFQTVFPEAVEGTKDAVDSDGNPEYQSIAQGTIFPDVVQALQAAIAKIEVLEAEVAALKSS